MLFFCISIGVSQYSMAAWYDGVWEEVKYSLNTAASENLDSVLDSFLKLENVEYKNVYYIIEPPDSESTYVESNITLGKALLILNKNGSKGTIHFDLYSNGIDQGHISIKWKQSRDLYRFLIRMAQMYKEQKQFATLSFENILIPSYDSSDYNERTESFKISWFNWKKSTIQEAPIIKMFAKKLKLDELDEQVPLDINMDLTYYLDSKDNKTHFKVKGNINLQQKFDCIYDIISDYNPFVDSNNERKGDVAVNALTADFNLLNCKVKIP